MSRYRHSLLLPEPHHIEILPDRTFRSPDREQRRGTLLASRSSRRQKTSVDPGCGAVVLANRMDRGRLANREESWKGEWKCNLKPFAAPMPFRREFCALGTDIVYDTGDYAGSTSPSMGRNGRVCAPMSPAAGKRARWSAWGLAFLLRKAGSVRSTMCASRWAAMGRRGGARAPPRWVGGSRR